MGKYNRGGSGYGGSVSFDYEIERYKHKESGEMFIDLPENSNEDDYELVTFEIEIEGSAHYTPGRTSGPPESCYPDDSDSEIEKAIGPDKKDYYHKLSYHEKFSINEMIIEKVQDIGEDCNEPDRYEEEKDRDDRDDYFSAAEYDEDY